MSYRERLFRQAETKRRECCEWLKQFMRPEQVKPMTKGELFLLAKTQLGISRSGFDQAWIRKLIDVLHLYFCAVDARAH